MKGPALALVLLGLLPASAGALTTHPSVSFNAAVQGSHNYAIGITNRGRKQVVLTVEKGDAQVSYTTRGKVTSEGIEADFGALGRIDVRFSAPRSSHGATGSPRCKGPAPRADLGTLRGTIRFKGEEGFTEAALHHTPALRIRTFRRTCHKRADRASVSAAAKRRTIPTLLGAADRSGGRNVSFAALGLETIGPKPSDHESEPGLFVIAAVGERRDGVAIFRQLLLIGERGVLLSELGVQPVSASVAPPPPFAGSASLSQAPGAAPTWQGDLTVNLPGARRVPLTGPGFQGVFCRSAVVRVFDQCALPIEEAQTSTQLSGSQSQAFLETKLSWLR